MVRSTQSSNGTLDFKEGAKSDFRSLDAKGPSLWQRSVRIELPCLACVGPERSKKRAMNEIFEEMAEVRLKPKQDSVT